MIGKTISHYKILEKLGEGGMGVLYKAEDTKLKRPVALKFLPPELIRDEEAKRRFIREAQAASALQHHNICTIHEIDETPDGSLFIAMDYYEGETLKDKIKHGPLPLDELLNYAIQTSEGLAMAHAAGMVHRDIKPANIMVTRDGVVKILDFGIAKLAEQTAITKSGGILGTPSYMSPEQAMGGELDERSDIFSLGIVLYELATGRPPFSGDHQAAVLYEIVHENPKPLTSSRPDLPREFEEIVQKAIEKKPEERYQRIAELLSDLDIVYKTVTKDTAAQARLMATRPWHRRLRPAVLWTAGIVIAALVAAIFIFYPKSSVPFSERDWILITDFRNLTADTLFDRSLDMALRIGIQQSQYINVLPRTRINEVLKRMGKARADTLDEALASEIALRANIRIVVEPTISNIGGVYLLSARIIDPMTSLDLKTEIVEAEEKDRILYALSNLAKKIRTGLGESRPSIARTSVGLPQATTSSLAALKKFSDGSRAWDIGKYDDAVAFWNEVVKLDSSFAWAHTTLGMYYYWYYKRPEGDFHFDRALRALDKTTERERLWILALIYAAKGNRKESIKYNKLFLSMFPDNRDAWFNLGNQYMRTEQHEKALEAYRKTVELDPQMSNAYINIATVYQGIGKFNESIENYEIAVKILPMWITHLTINKEYAFSYIKNGDFEKGREIITAMLSESDEKKAMGYRSLALLDMYLGKYSSAIEHLKKAIVLNKLTDFPTATARNHLLLAAAYKMREMMRDFIEQMKEFEQIHKQKYIAPTQLQAAGTIYLRAGMIEDAERLLLDISAGMDENNLQDRIYYRILKGELDIAKENYSEAVDALEMVSQLRRNSSTLEALALALYKSGDPDRAIETYKELIELLDIGWDAQEDWLQAHIRLGKIYEEIGDTENAAKYYRKLLDLWKEGDEDLPLLIEAKERLSKLSNLKEKS